jgi:hypothetical protein
MEKKKRQGGGLGMSTGMTGARMCERILLAAPAGAGILWRWAMRRLSLPRRACASCAFVGANPHFFFRESQRARLFLLLASIQKRSAKQRQFLEMNSVSSDQSQIGAHRATGLRAVLPHA